MGHLTTRGEQPPAGPPEHGGRCDVYANSPDGLLDLTQVSFYAAMLLDEAPTNDTIKTEPERTNPRPNRHRAALALWGRPDRPVQMPGCSPGSWSCGPIETICIEPSSQRTQYMRHACGVLFST